MTRELLARGHRVTQVVDEIFAAAVEESGARARMWQDVRAAGGAVRVAELLEA
ncbi:hypothetical protein PV729_33010 [Streptomyces europaeiscabiei]|uniref:Uncharacterized protein n=1 Tax=Streptomyces europaeiscabiei TaxID=146819 RepID=A0ABU4NLG4_9ACTN|nr:hypothetical protein [Streptomyces europaeiscabiei]MDX3546817.1 hypothetical protein [Streptomyces europaeiscabiei]MDX3556511.1 hypothetical protein [Streptomyces europaeiscabiei]MDX3703998.1 hypothetical protein [Streptomyces europaeiscabiei]